MKNAVGVLGGVGPLATVYFMEMIIEMTDASKDQEHIDMLVSNHATIPDRTGFILGESSESPMDAMVEDAQMLETAGCSFVVIPCNTAHYFFEDIRNSVQIPVLNIIEETIDYAKKQGSQRKIPREIKKLGILATEGTISSGTYSFYGKPAGVECVAPDPGFQKNVNHMIYDQIKAGYPVSREAIMEVIDHMRGKGCDAVIMGCTELSVIYRDLKLGETCEDVIDSLWVLARSTVLKSGKQLRD